jgi:hypothetical protein
MNDRLFVVVIIIIIIVHDLQQQHDDLPEPSIVEPVTPVRPVNVRKDTTTATAATPSRTNLVSVTSD